MNIIIYSVRGGYLVLSLREPETLFPTLKFVSTNTTTRLLTSLHIVTLSFNIIELLLNLMIPLKANVIMAVLLVWVLE